MLFQLASWRTLPEVPWPTMLKIEESQKLYERACQSLTTGVSTAFRRHVTPVPMYIERAVGPYFYDVDGNELIDYGLAWGPLIIGNSHPRLNAAIVEQISRGYTYGAQHRGEIELAEKMIRSIPHLQRVIFSNSGSEAVQAALRLARGFTGRDRIVKFEGHYNGWLNNVLVSNHPTPEQYGTTVPDCGGQPEAEYSMTITCPWNDLDALQKVFQQYPGEVAAVIGEPILVNGGSCMPKDGYLAGMIELCRQEGALSIFDEVITGFRIALGGAREYFGLKPDLSTYAKAIAGGFSLSAVGGRAEVFSALEDGRTSHFGTYNGNPISVAAALATMEVLSEPGLFDRMHSHGYAIREAVETAGKQCADQEIGDRVRAGLLERGIYNLPGGRWYVGATHSEKELERVLPAIRESMESIR